MNHWPCVKQLAHTVMLSTLEAATSEMDESETVNAMAGLSMQPPNRYDTHLVVIYIFNIF